MEPTEIGMIELRPLPTVTDDAFRAFLRDEVLPGIDLGPTRVGQVIRVTVTFDVTTDVDGAVAPRYLLLVEWSGGPGGEVSRLLNEELRRKLDQHCVVSGRSRLAVAFATPDSS